MNHRVEWGRIDRRSFVRRAAVATATWASGCNLADLARGDDRRARPLRVRVWCEGTAPRSVYPDDVDGALGQHLRRQKGMEVHASRLGEADAGLSDRALDATDVLIWWGRLRHADVPDARARAVADRVRAGKLGFVALHASCGSKPFHHLMGGPCEPGGWSDDGRPERVTIQAPGHEIARGVGPFTIPRVAMYEEPFRVPEPDTVVFVSHYDGDKSFRSGLTWTVGQGRVAYFRPGHDAFPVLFHPSVRRIIANAARWTAPTTA